jgi:hypothetical protein
MSAPLRADKEEQKVSANNPHNISQRASIGEGIPLQASQLTAMGTAIDEVVEEIDTFKKRKTWKKPEVRPQ